MSQWAQPLQTQADNPLLDLDDGIGQRSSAFLYYAVDIVTGYRTRIFPLTNQTPTLTSDISRTITRDISGLFFGAADTALLDSLRTRLYVYMLVDGISYPLGVYLYNHQARIRYTSGLLSTGSFYDQMFIVDQQIEHAFSGVPAIGPGGGYPPLIDATITIGKLLTGLPVSYTAEPSPYPSTGSWPAGTTRGSINQQVALDGDFFNPAFDNSGVMRYRRIFDPATAIPTFDFDAGNKVLLDPPPAETDDLIDTPNRIVVVSNSGSVDAGGLPVIGVYDVPSSAPHSIANRGFVVAKTYSRQVASSQQAAAIAANIGQNQIIFQTVELYTAPDPRHNVYDVIRWQGVNWLETVWSMQLKEGAPMRHLMRKAYT